MHPFFTQIPGNQLCIKELISLTTSNFCWTQKKEPTEIDEWPLSLAQNKVCKYGRDAIALSSLFNFSFTAGERRVNKQFAVNLVVYICTIKEIDRQAQQCPFHFLTFPNGQMEKPAAAELWYSPWACPSSPNKSDFVWMNWLISETRIGH